MEEKYVLALGLFFCAFEFLVSIFAYQFKTLALAFALAAIGGSLKSGTIYSIIYQSLYNCGKEVHMKSIWVI